MQIQIDFMARFEKNNAAKNRHVCRVEKWKKKQEKQPFWNEKQSRYEPCVKEVNQQSVNWIQVP